MEKNIDGESDRDADDGSVDGESRGGDALVVKSSTQVRFPRVMQRLFPYSRLELNTNLHTPPPNWLRNGPTIQVPNTWIRGEPADISSFGMADADIMDDVDVISASENIKKLLKIPFSNEQVSLAVHRIGKTLLLDKLDLYKHLRDASQSEKKWLKDVFIRLVQNEGENKFHSQHKTRENRQTSNLLSKFLYHSLGPGYDIEETDESQIPDIGKAIQQLPASQLPEDDVSQFARQVIWQFEDIRMLIGTDLPIFGGTTFPAVSLRLRDTESPINVLTGLDYWLDNLMCNVPELVMCYHLDGFVQKYELIKTEEIPKLENAQFSQKVVKDIAQNILSFINSNCTKEGHTYWLFKGKNDDVVKLYDLSSLMTEHPDCPWDNPFVVPVAMLLYRLARNMTQTAKITEKNKHIIVYLLNKCLSLLAQCRDQHLEIVAQANFILCQMFIEESRQGRHGNMRDDDGSESAWAGSSTTSSDVDDESNNEIDDDDQPEREKIVLDPIEIKKLTVPSSKTWKCKDSDRKRSKVKELNASKGEKAQKILEYVANGLRAIKNSIPESAGSVHQGSPSSSSQSARPLSLPPSPPKRAPLPPSSPERASLPPSSPERASLPATEAFPLNDKPCAVDREEPSSKSDRAEDHTGSRHEDEQLQSQESAHGRSSSEIDSEHDVFDGLGQRNADTGGRELPSTATRQEADIVALRCSDQSLTPKEQFHQNDMAGGVSCSDLVESGTSRRRSKAVAKEKPFPPGSWQETSGLLLLEKAYQAYSVLTTMAWEEHKHGKALLMAQLAIKCLNSCRSIHEGESNVYNILMMCGDSHLLLTHDPSNQHLHHEDYQDLTETDKFIMETAIIQQTSNDFDWATEFVTDTEDCLECSIKCYKACLDDSCKMEKAFRKSIGQKLGNACNELGVFFMNTAANLASVKDSMPSTFEQELWKESYRCFDTGIKSFEDVSDTTNVALLNCNMGRLMRLCAQSYASGGSMGPKAEFSSKEKHYYVKAAECYARGLHILGNKSGHNALWDSITWELCSTYFNMACLLQDQPPVSSSKLSQIEKDVLEAMSKALALCDTEETSSTRQPLYQYRAATIHHRLASMYHNAIRNQSSHMKKKHTKTLAELHYTKAVKLFKEMDRPVELLRVELERVALLEHQFESQTGKGPKVKTLEAALGIILDCSSVIPQLERLSYKIVPTTAPSNFQVETTPEQQKSDTDRTKTTEKEAIAENGAGGEIGKDPPRTQSGISTSSSSREGQRQLYTGSSEVLEHMDQGMMPSTGSQEEVVCDKKPCAKGKEIERTSENVTIKHKMEVINIEENSKNETHGEKTCANQRIGATPSESEGEAISRDNKDLGNTKSRVKSGRVKEREGDDVDGGDPACTGSGDLGGANAGACGGAIELSEGSGDDHSDPASQGNGAKGPEGDYVGSKSGVLEERTEGSEDEAAGTKSEVDEVKRLLTIFESRLQYVLLHLVKIMKGGKQSTQDEDWYKKMYVASLGRLHSSADSDKASLSSRLQDICKLSSVNNR